MKSIKILGIIIFLILAVVLIVPLFLAENVQITQTTYIQAQPANIYRQINNMSNWNNWSPFSKADPDMQLTFSEPPEGAGATQSWKSKKMGDGTLTIVYAEPYKIIKTFIDFNGQGSANGLWEIKERGDSTEVSWSITLAGLTYPFERYMGLMMTFSMKKMLKDGLDGIKRVSETLAPIPAIEIVQLQQQGALTILDSTKMEGIGLLLEKNYGAIASYIGKKKLSIVGAPFAIYHNWDPDGIIWIEAGMPIAEKGKVSGNIRYMELPETQAVFARHFGTYDTGNTHAAIEAYIKDHGLKTRDFVWEVYITDPSTEPDTAKWETDIYYPLR